MPTILDLAAATEYLALVRAFPLVSIRDDTHLADALDVIDRLVAPRAQVRPSPRHLTARHGSSHRQPPALVTAHAVAQCGMA